MGCQGSKVATPQETKAGEVAPTLLTEKAVVKEAMATEQVTGSEAPGAAEDTNLSAAKDSIASEQAEGKEPGASAEEAAQAVVKDAIANELAEGKEPGAPAEEAAQAVVKDAIANEQAEGNEPGAPAEEAAQCIDKDAIATEQAEGKEPGTPAEETSSQSVAKVAVAAEQGDAAPITVTEVEEVREFYTAEEVRAADSQDDVKAGQREATESTAAPEMEGQGPIQVVPVEIVTSAPAASFLSPFGGCLRICKTPEGEIEVRA